MFSWLQTIARRLIRKSTHIHHEPLNKVSIVILLLIDIFVLFNVFSGLSSIAQWPLNPSEQFPCFLPYKNYQTAKNKGTFELNVATLEKIIDKNKVSTEKSFKDSNRLGKVYSLCDNYTRLEKAVNNSDSIQLKADIEQLREEIYQLNQDIQTLQNQYDSTLLEKIAGQEHRKSINKATAGKIKVEINTNKDAIQKKENQILEKQKKLIQNPASEAYLKLINNNSEYEIIKKYYESAQFWQPNKQLLLQTLFLLPLIAIAYFWHSSATQRNKGLQALLSWHLLLIFCIPLPIKFFEFIQFGNLIGIILEWIIALFGGLIFIASYGLIILIPLLGFGLIKVLQILVFNLRVQAKNRVQKVRCINCNCKLRISDEFCPYCGFNQYINCSNCNQKTYKFTRFCRTCGHPLEPMQ